MDLADKPVDLKEHLGKDVMMLDFFATWCAPCVAALPEVSGVAKKYADRGLVFYAVNVGEDAATVKQFLESKGLDVPVAMDGSTTAAEQYGVRGIPQTVLIGKDGTVQAVHIGFSPTIAADLSRDVEELLAGKDLAAATLERARQQRDQIDSAGGVKRIWTVPGQWSGVAVSGPAGLVAAVSTGKNAVRLDVEGRTQGEFAIAKGGRVRLARLVGDATPDLIVFQALGASVKAYSAAGDALWEYPGGEGVNDVCVADLDGDGVDEVIIGYNGDTGLHVVDAHGRLLWKSADLKNVWNVTAGDFNNDQSIEVVATSGHGTLHALGADGRKLGEVEVPLYAKMVRMTSGGEGNAANAIVCGSGPGGGIMAGVNSNGDKQWGLLLPRVPLNYVDDLSVAAGRPWAAVAMRGGVIQVVDLELGRIIAHVEEAAMRPQVSWLPREGKSPLLVVATGKELDAFEVLGEKGE